MGTRKFVFAVTSVLYLNACDFSDNSIKGKIGLSSDIGCMTSPNSLSVWLDLNNDGVIQAGEPLRGEMQSYVTPSGANLLTVAQNYNYDYDAGDGNPASGIPTYGPTLEDLRNKLFFYQSSQGLMLFFMSSINNGSNGSVDFNMTTALNGKMDSIQLTDDLPGAEDTFDDLSDPTSPNNSYHFFFMYTGNTDGVVVGPFQTSNFEIRITMTVSGNQQDVDFASPTGFFPLNNPSVMGTPNQVFSFVIKRQVSFCN